MEQQDPIVNKQRHEEGALGDPVLEGNPEFMTLMGADVRRHPSVANELMSWI